MGNVLICIRAFASLFLFYFPKFVFSQNLVDTWTLFPNPLILLGKPMSTSFFGRIYTINRNPLHYVLAPMSTSQVEKVDTLGLFTVKD